MRIPSLAAFGVLLLIASSASAVTMDWTYIGNPGNPPESHPCGSTSASPPCGAVGYAYNIGTYEVTNAQYAEFLNAKAASDPLGLYSVCMEPAIDCTPFDAHAFGGITRIGSPGVYTYSAVAGLENLPVNYVTVFDAMRFANWMNNGQGSGDTETGAYTLLAPYDLYGNPSNGSTVTRNPGAQIVLPTENEWYKAAYYDALTTSYFDYPAGADAQTTCSIPTAIANRANCNNAVGDLTPVGSYPGSPSPHGTFDQGGNVAEFNETIIFGLRGVRGGSFDQPPIDLIAGARGYGSVDSNWLGFRLAMIPEPGSGLLVIAGLVGLAGWRRVRA